MKWNEMILYKIDREPIPGLARCQYFIRIMSARFRNNRRIKCWLEKLDHIAALYQNHPYHPVRPVDRNNYNVIIAIYGTSAIEHFIHVITLNWLKASIASWLILHCPFCGTQEGYALRFSFIVIKKGFRKRNHILYDCIICIEKNRFKVNYFFFLNDISNGTIFLPMNYFF